MNKIQAVLMSASVGALLWIAAGYAFLRFFTWIAS